jgi:hypothetical protein
MDKKQQLKLIDKTYQKIDNVLSIQHYGEYAKEYYNMNKKEELGHIKFCPESVTRGLTVHQATKLFYVKQIVEALSGQLNYITAKDYLYIRKSIFMSISLAENYKKELLEALKDINFNDILLIDYAELQKI